MERNEIIASFGYAGVRKLYIEQFNKDYDENWQCVHTPYDICHEMFELIPKDATHFVVFYSLEFLEVMVKEHNIDPSRILFVADTVYEQQFAMIKELYGVRSIVLSRGDVFVDGAFSESNFQKAIQNCYHYSVEEIFKKDENMKFNKLAVLGNPPYQMQSEAQANRTGGKAQAKALYNLFVESVIDYLAPDYFSMIVPSRWMVGGMGLDTHRERMMNDKRMKKIVHFAGEKEVFSSVSIKGGVNYFLWEKNYEGKCEFTENGNTTNRYLNEYDIIIQDNNAVSILEKVKEVSFNWINQKAYGNKPFGLATNFNEWEADGIASEGSVLTETQKSYIENAPIACIVSGRDVKLCHPSKFTDKHKIIGKWKVCTSKANGSAQEYDTNGQKRVMSEFFIIPPNTICTETYIVVNVFDNETEANHFVSYMKTKFFRFMTSIRVSTQDINKEKFAFVPDVLDYSVPWTDEELYTKFNLTRQQIAYIESKIKAIK